MRLLRLLSTAFIVLLLMSVRNTATAQTTVTIGTGTSVSASNDESGPFFNFRFSRHVMLYSAADLASMGVYAGATITKVAWYKTGASTLSAGQTATMNILMRNSSAAALTTGTWSTKTASMNPVYSNAAITTANIPAVAGWVEFTLTTPFTYNGGALEIATDWSAAGTGSLFTGNVQWQYTPTTNVQVIAGVGFAPMTGSSYLVSVFNRNMNIQLTYTAPPACIAPSSLGATTTTTSASLNWTANSGETAWNIEYGLSGFTQGTGTTITTTTNPHILTGLTHNTAYAYYVRADCAADGISSWSGPFNFTTLCGFYPVPYFEGFESGHTDAVVVANCLTQQTTSTWKPAYWKANTLINSKRAPRTGGWNTLLDGSSTLFIPVTLVGGTSYVFECYARQSSNLPANTSISVSYGTSNTAAAMNNPIAALTTVINGSYEQIVGVFTPTTSGNYYIGIKGVVYGAYAAVDDISVKVAPSCSFPSALTATNISDTSALLGWTAGGTATTWDIEYGVIEFDQGTGTTITGINSNPYNLTGLTPATTYEFYVRSNCGGATSIWIGPFSFKTICAAFVAPYTADFEGALVAPYTNLPYCWAPQDVNSNVWTVANGFTNSAHIYLPITGNHTPGSGNWNYMWLDASGINNPNAMETRLIDMSALLAPYAGFWFASNNTNAPINHTIVLDAWDGTAWVTLVTKTGNFPSWVEVGAPVPPTIPTITKFRIYAVADPLANSSNYFYNDLGIDDFFVISRITCPAPTNLDVAKTPTSATLSWTAGGTETAWDIQWGAQGFQLGTGTLISGVTTNPYTLNNLSPNFYYSFYVRADCGTPDGVSYWVGPFNFYTTYCTPSPISLNGLGITEVTMGGITNPSGTEAGNYGSYIAIVANAPQGGTLAIDVTYRTGYTYDTWAWVDWNNNLEFTDAGEEYYLGNSTNANPTTLSSSISIPATALGHYRIRIGGANTGLPTSPANSCYVGAYGTFEDYTLNVSFPLLTPANNTTLLVAGTTQSTIQASWQANTQGGIYEWRAAPLNGSLNSPVLAFPSDNMGMDTTITFTIQNLDSILTNLGVAVGDSAQLQWTVVTFLPNGDSLFAVAPFNITLIRDCNLIVTTSSVADTSAAGVGQASTIVTNGTAPYTYAWSNGDTTATITGLTTGNYTVTVTDANGCEATSTVFVNQFVTTFALLAPTNNTTLLVAGTAQSTIQASWEANTQGGIYEWRAAPLNGSLNSPVLAFPSDNMGMDTTITFTVQNLDSVLTSLGVAVDSSVQLQWTVVAFSPNGDSLFATAPFNITLIRGCNLIVTTSSVSDTSITSVGQASTIVTNGTAPYTYAWSNGGTTATITGLATGNYTVTVTDASNCEIIETIFVDVVSTHEAASHINNLTISPNPTRGQVAIRLELTKIVEVNIKLYSINGQLVRDLGNYNTIGEVIELDLNNEPQGVYFVRFIIEGNVVTRKIVLTK